MVKTTLEYWNHLISDFRCILKEGSNASTNRQAWQKTVDALDRLVDEIKSENMIPKEIIPKIVVLFHKTFTFGRDTVDYWAFKHMALFAMIHIYNQYDGSEGELLELIQEKGLDSELVHENESFLTDCLFASVHDVKREVRDAAGQNFGALVSILGNDLIDLVLPSLLEQFKSATKESFEGLMMVCGYLVSRCKDISESNWNTLTQLLIVEAENTSFASYSRYVRVNALKGLIRVVQSPTISSFSSHVNVGLMLKAIRATLRDEDIDVRRASGSLYSAYYTFLSKLYDDPSELIRSSLQYFKDILSNEDTRWQVRHGIACAAESIAQSIYLVENFNHELTEEWLQFLSDLIQRDDLDKSSFASNATAGYALVQLLISQEATLEKKIVYECFNKYARPQLEFMLQSPHPQLLDAAARIIEKLTITSLELVSPFMERFLSLLYKNRFHAAYPIRSSANITWERAHKLIFQDKTELELVSHLTQHMIPSLLEASIHKNYEVRETVFQALSSILKVTTSNFPSTEEYVEKIYTNLLLGARDTTGGNNSDYPRAAAIRGVASYMYYCSRFNVDISRFVEKIKSLIKENLENITETLIVKATLSLIEVIGAYWNENFSDVLPMYALHTYKISHMIYEDEIRFPAIPSYINCFGSGKEKLIVNSSFLSAFFDALDDQLSDEVDEAERDAIARVLRDLSIIDLSNTTLSSDDVSKMLSFFEKSISNEENRQSPIILSGCLLFLSSLSRNSSFKEKINEFDVEASTLIKSIECILRNEEEIPDDVTEKFELLDFESSLNLNKFEVCISILVNLLESSTLSDSNFLTSILNHTLETCIEDDRIRELLAKMDISSKLNKIGFHQNLTEVPPCHHFESVEDIFSKIESPDVESETLIEEWDILDDEISETNAFLAPHIYGFLYGNLFSGRFFQNNKIVDETIQYLQGHREEISNFLNICCERIANSDDVENLVFVLHLVITQYGSVMRQDIVNSDLQTIVESKLDETDISHLWLLYGSVIDVTSDVSEDIFTKVTSSDWRVEIANRCGEGFIPYVAIAVCHQAIQFKLHNNEERFAKCLQTFSDILHDDNIVENKDLLRFGYEALVRKVGGQVTPDPSAASGKSNSTFVTS